MRFMLFMIPGPEAENRWMPTAEEVTNMQRYNDEMTKAGIVLALDGLLPQEKGARVNFDGPTPKVIDGPFTEAKEVVGGYWIVQCKSLAEAIEWAKRCPVNGSRCTIEVRQIAEMSDFPQDVQDVFAETT